MAKPQTSAPMNGPSSKLTAPIPDTAGYGIQTQADALKRFTFTKYQPFPPGLPVVGIFAGYGGPRVIQDMNRPGRFRRIHTWLLKISEGLTFRVPGSAQINGLLPFYPVGDEICIVQAVDKVKTKKGNQANDFMVSDPKSAWTRLPSVKLEDFDGEKGEVDPDEVNPAEVLVEGEDAK